MKFGRKIKTDIYSEWKEYYIDYNALKKFLKEGTSSGRWTTAREAQFIKLLEAQLEKIQSFQQQKAAELGTRIKEAENEVRQLVDDYDADSEGEQDVEAGRQRQLGRSDDVGSDDDDEQDDDSEAGLDSDDDADSIDAVEERWNELEEQVAILVADVHDLALYTKLNFTGFMKIVKKHDKQTGLSLKTTFIHDYLEKRPFYKYNWDAIIVTLSRLNNLVRTRGHPVEGDSSAGGAQSAFVRQTTKYWVHPDNIVHLKLQVLRHLPVLVFNPNKEFEISDSAITSIYFDNEDLELYLGRVEKTEGAEAIRLRWYGGMDVKTIFVERKTHREDWTGEKSVKARFPIKEDKVNAYLKGEYTMDAEFEALFTKGKKTRQEVDSMIQLAREVQYSILTRKLQPVMRTFYNRTAFQLPGDARVRISLDTELTMVREDNWDGNIRSGANWRRMDIGIDHPFSQIAAQDRELFPYGVLEVKLQTQLGQEPPLWVRELVSSHLVESVPKFSKFIHGCATLLPSRVDLIPFWLPQMDIDIRKPDTGKVTIDRPTPITSTHNTDTTTTPELASPLQPFIQYTEPLSEGEEDENMDVGIANIEGASARVPLSEALEAIAFREKNLKAQEAAAEQERAQKQLEDQQRASTSTSAQPQGRKFLKKKGTPLEPGEHVLGTGPSSKSRLSIDPLAPSEEFDKRFKKRLNRSRSRPSRRPSRDNSRSNLNQGEVSTEVVQSRQQQEEERLYLNDYTAQVGKKIAVPVRVEPKVFFAQERTFLKWLHIAVLLGTVATTLMNFTDGRSKVAFVSATGFTITSLLAIAYSAGIFLHRVLKLRNLDADALYYDPYGPTVLCGAVIASVIANFVMQWTHT